MDLRITTLVLLVPCILPNQGYHPSYKMVHHRVAAVQDFGCQLRENSPTELFTGSESAQNPLAVFSPLALSLSAPLRVSPSPSLRVEKLGMLRLRGGGACLSIPLTWASKSAEPDDSDYQIVHPIQADCEDFGASVLGDWIDMATPHKKQRKDRFQEKAPEVGRRPECEQAHANTQSSNVSVARLMTKDQMKSLRYLKDGDDEFSESRTFTTWNANSTKTAPTPADSGIATGPQLSLRKPSAKLGLVDDTGNGNVHCKDVMRDVRRKDKSDRATVDQVLDPRTIRILQKLVNNGYLCSLHGCISTGKEANVYHALGIDVENTTEAENTSEYIESEQWNNLTNVSSDSGIFWSNDQLGGNTSEMAVKIYKTSILSFKDRDRYVTGDYRFRRGYSKNPRKMVTLWAEKEFRNLNRIWAAGIP